MDGSWIPQQPEPEFDEDLEEVLKEYENPSDLGLKDDYVYLLARDVQELRNAIRKHRDERGHDRCWLDDQELYKALPEGLQGDSKLPPKEEFIKNCHRYWEHRQDPSVAFIRQRDVDEHRILQPMSTEDAVKIAKKAGILTEDGELSADYKHTGEDDDE
jgi:hypothetical protein